MSNIEILTINLGGSNSYLLKCDGGYLLVDAGMKGAAARLEKELAELGGNPKDIKLIIITHSHTDHIGGLEEVRKLTGAPVAMHPGEQLNPVGKNQLRKNESSLVFRMIVSLFGKIGPEQEDKPIVAEVDITDGMNLGEYGVDARIIHTPGHSPGSVCIVTGDNRCIAGDTLFRMFPFTHYPIIVYDRKKLAETYRRLDSLNICMYYPGHGAPIPRESFKRKIMGRKKYF